MTDTAAEIRDLMQRNPYLSDAEAAAVVAAGLAHSQDPHQLMDVILKANDYALSVAEARTKAEGRPYVLARDHSTFDQSSSEIQQALLRELDNNVDVGELLVHAVIQAQQAARAQGKYLTQNRPGSWEASLLEPLIQAEQLFDRLDESIARFKAGEGEIRTRQERPARTVVANATFISDGVWTIDVPEIPGLFTEVDDLSKTTSRVIDAARQLGYSNVAAVEIHLNVTGEHR